MKQTGLRTEGIFRLSGATCEVVALQKKINICTPEERKAIDASVYDVHTLASLVKKYLRELPEPVIPNGFHEQLQQVNLSDAREGIRQLSAILIKLPFHNRQLIHAILLMAVKIQLHVEKNMMCPEALATVFAPVCTGFEQSLRKDTMPKSSGTKAPNKKSYSTPTNTLNKKRYQKNAHLPFDFSAAPSEVSEVSYQASEPSFPGTQLFQSQFPYTDNPVSDFDFWDYGQQQNIPMDGAKL